MNTQPVNIITDLSYHNWSNWLLKRDSSETWLYHVKIRARAAMSKHIGLMKYYAVIVNKPFNTFERLKKHGGDS